MTDDEMLIRAREEVRAVLPDGWSLWGVHRDEAYGWVARAEGATRPFANFCVGKGRTEADAMRSLARRLRQYAQPGPVELREPEPR